MKKFVFIYYSEEKPDMSKMDEDMAAWKKWFDTIGKDMADPGNPFAEGGMALDPSGSKKISADMWPATGYTIVKAKSMDDAVKIAEGCPALKHKDKKPSIRVYETMEM